MSNVDLFGTPLLNSSLNKQSATDSGGDVETEAGTHAERVYMERLERLYAGDPPHAEPLEIAFRHGGWKADRSRVRDAMVRCGVGEKRLQRFDACGGGCVCEVEQGTGRGRLKAFYCGDRFCVPCSTTRGRRVTDNLRTMCHGHVVRFLTLTLRATNDPMTDVLDRLIRSFKRLRDQKFWQKGVKGGAYCVEIKRGKGSGKWHVHLHALIIGSYLPHHELSQGWSVASGGSFVVGIEEVGRDSKRVEYVAKYATKGFDRSVLVVPDDLDECLCALRGRRVFGTFGCWRSVELEREPSDRSRWKVVGRFADVWREALRGDLWASGFLKSLGIDPRVRREQRGDDRSFNDPGWGPEGYG